MTLRHHSSANRARGLLGVGAALTLALAISGCATSVSPTAKGQDQQQPPKSDDASQVSAPEVSAADIEANIGNHDSGVNVSRTVKLNVADGTFKNVVVRSHSSASTASSPPTAPAGTPPTGCSRAGSTSCTARRSTPRAW